MSLHGEGVYRAACLAVLLCAAAVHDRAAADTLNYALVQAYQNNPQLSAQRAATRAVDENVAIQLGGYRPKFSATTSISEVYLDTLSRNTSGKLPPYTRTTGENAVTSLGLTGTQTLFN